MKQIDFSLEQLFNGIAMRKLLFIMVATLVTIQGKAQVFQLNASDFGITTNTPVAAEMQWADNTAVTLSNAFATNHDAYSCANDGYTKVLIDNNEIQTAGVHGYDNPKDADNNNPATTLNVPASGSVIQIEAKKNGWLYIVARLSSNKQYMVFEDGEAIGYKYALENLDSRVSNHVMTGEVGTAGSSLNRSVKSLICEYTGDSEAASAGDGLGVFYFPVKKGSSYYAHACGSKIFWCGAYFSKTEAEIVKVVKEDESELVLVNQPSPNITFADSNVKALCVANWDTNDDGELSEAEAAAVTDLGEVFKNTSITSFNELQYFIGLENIGDYAFRGCSGLTSITIPNSVTSIGNYAFYKCSGLTSVTIPNSVTSIGNYAFSDCSGLTSVTIPNSVTSIGESAFYNCSGLTSVTIPNSVTNIGRYAFSFCSGLTSITIPNSVTSIESSAFSYCSGLTSITIPNSVTSIGSSAFSSCSGLTSVTIPNSVTSIESSAFYNCSGLTSITIPNSVTSIGECAFQSCSGLTSVTIPNSVTSIGWGTFYNCSGLTSITIPNSVTSIGTSAFKDCSGLTSITIPNSVTSIGSSAFYGCSGLTSVTIPNSVTSIGISAFYNCSGLTSITIPNSVTSIGEYAFSSCSGLTSVTIPNSVTSIGQHAFSYCFGLTSITIPNSVTSIGTSAFSGCSGLTSVTIPNSVTSIGESAFGGCSGLTSVTIPNSVTSIRISAFYNCSGLTSINIPNSVTSIGDYAFYNCSGLTSITIPNNVTSIGSYAFESCSGLTSVISKIETPFAFGALAFYGISNDCVLTVPYGTRDAYLARGWTESVFKGGVVENDNVVIAMETGSGAPRTMIGYSSQYSMDFTGINDVRAYIAIGFTDTKNVLMARVNVVPANTGIVLKSDVAGVEVEVPITTSDVYYANLLKPAVNNVTIYPTEDIDAVNYTNLMVGKLANEQMGFVTLPSSKAYSNKCYLQIPTAFYNGAASAREGGLEMEFVDTETTDIRSLMHQGSVTNDAYYDLQGRKVIPVKKGIYIKNGKKVIVK